jgi:hypothetical protein
MSGPPAERPDPGPVPLPDRGAPPAPKPERNDDGAPLPPPLDDGDLPIR